MAAGAKDHLAQWTEFEPDDTRVALLVVAHAWLEAWPEWPLNHKSAPPLSVHHLQTTIERIQAIYGARYPRLDGSSPDWHTAVRWIVPSVRQTIDVILGTEAANALPERNTDEAGPALELNRGTGGKIRTQLHGFLRDDGVIEFAEDDLSLETRVQPVPTPPDGPQDGGTATIVATQARERAINFAVYRAVDGDATLFSAARGCVVASNISIGEPRYLAVHVAVDCPLGETVGGTRGHSPVVQLTLYLGASAFAADDQEHSGAFTIHIGCEEDATHSTLRCGRLWPLAIDPDFVSLEEVFASNHGVLTLHTKPGTAHDRDAWLPPRLLAHVTWDGATHGRDVDATISSYDTAHTGTWRDVGGEQPTHAEL